MKDLDLKSVARFGNHPSQGGQRPPPPLRRVLLSAMLAVLALTLVIGGVATYLQSLAKIDTEVGSAVANARKAIREALPELDASEQPSRDLMRLVRSLDGNRHVRARLTLAEPQRGSAEQTVIESSPAPAKPVPRWFVALFPKTPVVYRVELSPQLVQFASLELVSDTRSEIVEIWDDALLKIIILMAFCVVLCGLIYYTLERALQPLTSILDAFEHLGDGDYQTNVAVKGPAELSRLCEGVNALAHRLETMEERNQRLNDQLETLQEEERADLARDLHDEISPFLFSVDVDASAVRQLGDDLSAPEVSDRAEAIREATAHMMKHVRSILGRLRPATHMDLGLEHAVEALVSSWRLRKPNVVFTVSVDETGFDEQVDVVIHGIVREGLSNALKHGRPGKVDVSVIGEDAIDGGSGDVVIRVRDDGAGLNGSDTANAGFGLISMRERVAALGGHLSLTSRSDRTGTELTVRLPRSTEERAGDQRRLVPAGVVDENINC